MQLTFLGIIGEYLGRMFDEMKRRPLYLLKGIELPTEPASSASAAVLRQPAGIEDASMVS